MTLKTKFFLQSHTVKNNIRIYYKFLKTQPFDWLDSKIFKLLCTSNRGLLELTAPSHERRKALTCLHTTLGTKLCKQILSLYKEEITGEYHSLWKEESTFWWIQIYSSVPRMKSNMQWSSTQLPALPSAFLHCTTGGNPTFIVLYWASFMCFILNRLYIMNSNKDLLHEHLSFIPYSFISNVKLSDHNDWNHNWSTMKILLFKSYFIGEKNLVKKITKDLVKRKWCHYLVTSISTKKGAVHVFYIFLIHSRHSVNTFWRQYTWCPWQIPVLT